MDSEIKNYIRKNPEEADNIEDLLNWTCDKFNINDEKTIEEIFIMIKKEHPSLEN